MATAVLDLDFYQLPLEITGLERYTHALILIRLRGRPISQTFLSVVDGRISNTQLRDIMMDAAGLDLWKHWLYEYLEWDETRVTNTVTPSASIAVCTRNRPEDLRRCLDTLMCLPNDGQELLVVDSCSSTDETRRVVESYSGVRYIREDRPGLNIARNRALHEARHEIVTFIDDDATADPGWLRALLRNFGDPLVLCTTGLTMPLELETEAQECFETYNPFNRGFTRKVFDKNNLHPLAAGHAGAGVNTALRRSVLKLVGPFDEALDAGTPTHSGGDNEMFTRILASGYRIVYDPAALSWHRHRRTWEELRQTVYGYGVGVYAAWTRSLLVERELTAPLIAWSWFSHSQFPNLVRSILRRPGSFPLTLLLAELFGCAIGPWAYLYSRSHLSRRNAHP